MKTVKQSDGWWIVDVPNYRVDEDVFTSCGPYRSKAEADDDRRGLSDFYRRHPQYVSDSTATQRTLF
jgi:hypothetical protein